MVQKAVVMLCKELGCCNACCLRYIGVKNPKAYENSQQYILKFTEIQSSSGDNKPSDDLNKDENVKTDSNIELKLEKEKKCMQDNLKNGTNTTEITESNGSTSPPAKRKKSEICLSCLGILQENTWHRSLDMVKEQLDKKKYECESFACALSAPIATLLREKAITLSLKNSLPDYDTNCLTPLKEAWKWSFGIRLETHVGKTLESGTSSPLLITVVMEYPDDLTELEIVKVLSPSLFEARRQQRKRFAVELTRRSVEQALDGATFEALQKLDWRPAPSVGTTAHCASVSCSHTPHYLGGRYIKLSRELPQTPWLVNGKRMLESSVQEAIFEPLAKLYQMSPEEVECRLKFISAGREDVDVRCLGEGRPFAIEVADPRRLLTPEELKRACDEVSKGGKVILKQLVYVTKDDLALLKKGEETKTKTYEALCIKLSHTKDDENTDGPPVVTDRDICNINSFNNSPSPDARIVLQQKTPIRVLHRRPLLTRTRKILHLEAKKLPDSPQLFWVRLVTEAGTYVKEWAHGELGRTTPSLSTALGARTDILALDVSAVDLAWPNTQP